MQNNTRAFKRQTIILLGLVLATAACSTTPTTHSDARDPWEGWNRNVQGFNDGLDDYVMKPVSKGYQKVTPSFLDRGFTNFFNNVDDIGVILNDLLQLKFAQTGMDTGRFLVNTTMGLGGMVDVATNLNLPKHNEDLDQTLGTWGLPSGPYIVLPLIGPTTPRGAVGLAGDTMANPINWINPAAYAWGAGTLRTVDQRADLLSATNIMDQASVDRYEFIRNAYFQDRNYKIHDGNPPLDEEMERELESLESDQAEPASPENAQ